MMQALVFKRYGKSNQPEHADIPRPALGPNDLLVRVHAMGNSWPRLAKSLTEGAFAR